MAYTAPPVRLEDIRLIEPMGKLHGSHVTPTDHTYIGHNQTSALEAHQAAVQAGRDPQPWEPTVDVMSPADGYITDIGAFPFGSPPFGFTGILQDYRMEIWHSCAVATIFIHLAGLPPEIRKVTGDIPSGGNWSFHGNAGNSIPVMAGQVIGQIGAHSVDYSVHDNRVVLGGFVVPDHYQGEPWKIHTVDPFAYFTEPLRSQLLAKSPRTAEPRGGRIDYDIDGRLVGNWFLEGTVDYSGGSSPGLCGNRPCPYWTGHLSIAYDHIDPGQIRISIGAGVGIGQEVCRVCESVYGVLGNSPDPAGITPQSGVVKYGLVAREHTGEYQVATKNIESRVLGTFLVEMTGQRTIKMEVVSGSRPSQVDGFSQAAKTYHR
ncbi:MAG: hypothetical protein BZY80_00145 [SAR202 cluster bacterium Io17-Chloro-G2]|nr:MAG: hypothetical protein BZY80_00145 [SAR202 cluster bacterium Io17-Chloro-G2]